jgi:DNA repair protein RecN (Recombination protein N)
MLSVLKIKNLALVDDLTWEVGSGLVGVTGETGAGKSMIVGALKLILGERANHDLVRNGELACTVEAVFELSSNINQVNELLDNAGLEPCDGNTLVLKRVFSSAGSNKQFINCSPATLAILRKLGDTLVDLHGAHEHQSLLSRERQLAMLDAYAGSEKLRTQYRDAHRAWQTAVNELNECLNAERAGEQEIDLLRFQVEEIESAELDAAELADLENRYERARNGSRLIDAANEGLGHLSSDVLDGLGKVQKALREIERLDPATVEITAGFDSAQVELEELERALRDYAEGLELNPAEFADMERRIDQVEGLKRKYGATIEDVIEFGERANARLAGIDGRGEEIERLETEAKECREALNGAGAALAKKRRAAAPRLGKEIARHLEDLGFVQSKFSISLDTLDAPSSNGLEEADFLFAPNPGEPPKPLRVIASSGEMSRVMLAVKSALAQQDQIPLMVFDEIDANVGGEIAVAVGKKMASLGKQHQVVAITHMPQVAALAHCHYVVAKEFKNDSTRSTLVPVEGESRVAELSRMLGGGGASAKALAESMLEDAAV